MAETKQPTLTSNMIPKAPVVTNAEVVSDDSIVARPLMTPDFINMKPKNPAVTLRWVNCRSGEGLRYNHMLAVGFVNALPQDLVSCPTNLQKEGKIIFGDLILMKINSAAYKGALKYNEEQARLRMRKSTAVQHGRKTVSEVPAPPDLLRKIAMFEPNPEEIEKSIGDTGGLGG